MGKKSKKNASAATRRTTNNSRGSGSGSSNGTGAASASTQGTAAVGNANAATMEEMEPIVEFDMDVWEARFPFAAKTSDPQAKDLDKAQELFLKGIQYANNDNLRLASEYIASAYLRDERVLIYHDGVAEKALDFETFKNIMNHEMDRQHMPLSLGILCLIMSLSRWSNQCDIVAAMKFLNTALDLTQEMLETSTLGQLGGLTHAKVYYWRGRLFLKMLNGKSAIKDWTKALELDPSLAVARMARLHHWIATDMKTLAELHAECVIFLGLVHVDYSELDVIYALLASKTFRDFRLGTYADSMEYYRKSLQATSRRVELYGPREEPNDILRHVRRGLKSKYEDPEGADAKARKELDAVIRMTPSDVGDYPDLQPCVDKTKRNLCLNCKKHEGNDGIQLRKCSRCKRVYYCSKECIRANWKVHKVFCNEISGPYSKPTVSTVPVVLEP